MTEDGQELMTDFDFYEDEIEKFREMLATSAAEQKQRDDDLLFENSASSSADLIGLRRDFHKTIDICTAMLQFAKEKHAENE